MTESAGLITKVSQAHEVARCPQCAQSHSYVIVTTVRMRATAFGGPGDSGATWDVDFVCPVKLTKYASRVELDVAADGGIISVASADAAAEGAADGATAGDWLGEDLRQFLRDSRSVARDYCRTMLSTSFGAIPVYVTLAEYVDVSTTGSERLVAYLPPVLFLLGGLAFALALQARLARIGGMAQYAAQREHWHRRVNALSTVGLGLFVGGTLLALVTFAMSGWGRA